jgi:predicted dienelactone hydrolase
MRTSPALRRAILLLLVGIGGCADTEDAVAPQVRGTVAERRADRKGAETVTLAGRTVAVWRPASATGPAPLLIFSHGFHGAALQSSFLMRALAADGWLVVAPDHKDARPGLIGRIVDRPDVTFGNPQKWSAAMYRDRADDVGAIVGALKADPAWASAVDWSQVALAGHSLGGYTVLGVAGGWPGWKQQGIRAVLALSPYAGPFVEHRTLGALEVPVMYQSGTRDAAGILASVRRDGGAFDMTRSPAYYVEFQGAGHLAWTDLVSRYQDSVTYYSLAFLDSHVRGNRSRDPSSRRSDVSDLRVK